MQKLQILQKRLTEESSWAASSKRRSDIPLLSISMEQQSLSQPSQNAYIGYWCEFSKRIFFFSVANSEFPMTFAGPQKPTRSRAPLRSWNAKILTISLEGTLLLETTKLIFGMFRGTQ